jgi:D-alanine--poly(phosphoribitol) ligase subunit 2
MNAIEEKVLGILSGICNTERVKSDRDIHLFHTGLMDSFATVDLLMALEDQLNVNVPISDFDREEWATPNKIVRNVEARV